MPDALTVGSLFSGIGGFDLGFERAGMRTLWFCEQDPFCQRVLAKHWPGVPVHPDVRALVADTGRERRERRGGPRDVARSPRGVEGQGLQRQRRGDAARDRSAGADGASRPVPVPVPYVDVLCGGFPCQDISLAGKGAGIDGARSGLWAEYARLICELRPRYVVVENVSALLARGLGRVLGDLAEIGYDAEWDCIPASAVGAPHRRDRVWLVAYPDSQGQPDGAVDARPRTRLMVPNPDGERHERTGAAQQAPSERRQSRDAGATGLADPEVQPGGSRLRAGGEGGERWRRSSDCSRQGDLRRSESGVGVLVDGLPTGLDGSWDREPDIPRVAASVPERVQQLRALGNALVPQIAQWIGHRIITYEEELIGA